MSQAKVDRKKQDKINRKQIMKREKFRHRASMTIAALICVAIIGFIGFSAVDSAKNASTANPATAEVDVSAISDYANNMD